MNNYIVYFVAMLLSAVAAYFSIAGLATLFAAAVIPIVIMGSSLEIAKVVTVSWLYKNWEKCPSFVKYYLMIAVVILMFITSMGTFGYLSKAHIDQTIGAGDTSVELTLIDQQIDSEKKRISNAQKTIDSMDKLVDNSDTDKAINLRKSQGRERTRVYAEITEASKTIKSLSEKALPLRKESLKKDAEVGPIKYIAQLFKDETDQADLEKAVRWVIILIVSVFDPLAIMLFLAANIGFGRPEEPIDPDEPGWLEKTLALKNKKKSGTIELNEEDVMTFK